MSFLWVEWEVTDSPILHRQRFRLQNQGMIHHKYQCKQGWRLPFPDDTVCVHDSASGRKTKKTMVYRRGATVYYELGTPLDTVIEIVKDYIRAFYPVKEGSFKVWTERI